MGGLRAETFTFDVRNRFLRGLCRTTCRPDELRHRPPENESSSWVPGPALRFFANYGEGYHSNDARSTVVPGSPPARREPRAMRSVCGRSPGGQEGVELLATLWRLDLKSELVFVGDEGTTEIRGASRRMGVGGGRARTSLGATVFQRQRDVYQGGVSVMETRFPSPLKLRPMGHYSYDGRKDSRRNCKRRILGARPLVEDRSVKSSSWIDFDLSERYQLPITLSHGRLEAFLFVQNLFNTKWEQAIFAFESQLRNEAAPVNGIHFVPGNPRTFMGGVAWCF